MDDTPLLLGAPDGPSGACAEMSQTRTSFKVKIEAEE